MIDGVGRGAKKKEVSKLVEQCFMYEDSSEKNDDFDVIRKNDDFDVIFSVCSP